jgi:hypothetical protein
VGTAVAGLWGDLNSEEATPEEDAKLLAELDPEDVEADRIFLGHRRRRQAQQDFRHQ